MDTHTALSKITRATIHLKNGTYAIGIVKRLNIKQVTLITRSGSEVYNLKDITFVGDGITGDILIPEGLS